jgi:predicted RNase H-like nuclease (RuvC/YqgF family)
MGDTDQLELSMAHIPIKSLYNLQTSVMEEVQSRAHVDATNLEFSRGVTKILQITCDELNLEKEEGKGCIENLEKGLIGVYNCIPDTVHTPNRSTDEKINIITQRIEGYRKEIEELKEKLNPMTPPEFHNKI